MKPSIKKKWVAALRSGEYKQTTIALRKGASFCCLGVLCNLHAQAHKRIAAKEKHRAVYMGECELLPDAVIHWAGLEDRWGGDVHIKNCRKSLAEHNDSGATFKQIAAAIEAQL
jgi:hypothetical protein